MPDAVLLTGTLKDRQGEIVANTRVVFHPQDDVVGQYGAVVLPIRPEATSDEAGQISLLIYPGRYDAKLKTSDGSETFEVAVPEGASAVLSDLIDGPDVVITPQVLLDAQEARDQAQAAQAGSEAARDASLIAQAASEEAETGASAAQIAAEAAEANSAADAVATAADRVQTNADVVATGEDVVAAAASEAKARDWAEKTDGEVEAGTYSAKHWATHPDVQAVADNIEIIEDAAGPLTAVQIAMLQMATAFTNSQTRYVTAVAFI